jgi:hypothetical protein
MLVICKYFNDDQMFHDCKTTCCLLGTGSYVFVKPEYYSKIFHVLFLLVL